MNILILTRGIPSKYHPQWGCFEKDQAEALASFGHKVVCISFDTRFRRHKGRLGLHHYENINGVEYYNKVLPPKALFPNFFNYQKFFVNSALKKIYNKLQEEKYKPDIIYSQFYLNTLKGGKFLKDKYNVPLVTVEHLGRFNSNKLDSLILQEANFAYNISDKVIAVSSSLKARLKYWFNIEAEVVHNTYSSDFGQLVESNNNKIFTFISTASLLYLKGFDVLIKALANTSIPKDKWKLNIIGWGEERKNLEKLIKAKKLENNVFLLGKMDKKQIANQLSKSDVFVLPSRTENFSVAILEALSLGLPVIATDCGGIRECLTDKNGIIVPVDNIEALSKALEYIYNNYTKFDKKEIYDDCKARFSPQAIAKQLTQIFNETIEESLNKNK